MIEAREFFAPVCANSIHTVELRASPYWDKLARMMKLRIPLPDFWPHIPVVGPTMFCRKAFRLKSVSQWRVIQDE